jgi:GT2 family glycosyltransferase
LTIAFGEANMTSPEITLSVVSHGHAHHVRNLLADLDTSGTESIEIILTLNSSADVSLIDAVPAEKGRVIKNPSPKGFGANHNAAFRLARGQYFCVCNPDIRLRQNPFPLLVAAAEGRFGIVGPRVIDSRGETQNNYRRVPTPGRFFRRVFGRFDYDFHASTLKEVDWIAGMFMLFRREVYEVLGGFDEHYFLYYEDVDICCRARLAGWRVGVEPKATLVHDARWDSHGRPQFLFWHLASLLRFWRSSTYRKIRNIDSVSAD